MRHVFGPVPSRRLGNSLGVDVVPAKTCTLNCLYCECGPTNKSIIERRSFFPPSQVIDEIKSVTSQLTPGSIDHITFSGSGEPTLNSDLEELIERTGRIRSENIAVISNSTLLYLPEVRKALAKAHLVIPTLSTVFQSTFVKLHRPVSEHILVENVISGLQQFCREYKGKISIELFFVPGINDTPHEIKGLVDILETMTFDELYFNTLARPGTKDDIQPVSRDRLQIIREYFPESWKIEIAGDYQVTRESFSQDWDSWKEMLIRRPVSMTDLAAMSGMSETEVDRMLEELARRYGLKVKKTYDGLNYIRLYDK